MFIFLDESGNFKGNNGPCFILGGFVTGNQRRTKKVFLKWQHTKFPRKLKAKTEVKFSDTGLTDEMRLKTIQHLAGQDIRVFYTFLNHKNIPFKFRNENSIEAGKLYAEVVGHTLQLLFPVSEKQIFIYRDTRHLKGITQSEFNQQLKLDLAPEISKNTRLEIRAVDSTTNTNIQIADWICGALYRYYNELPLGDKFYAALKSNIVGSEELFKNY